MALVRGAAVALVASGLLLSGCGMPMGPTLGDVMGIGNDRPAPASAAQTGIGVNAYLWQASLDTLSFMPLASADPWGGVINYDWYINPQTPNERFKATVFILDTRLRADALNVSVTKQVKADPACAASAADPSGAACWTASPVSAQTETDLENAILTKARQLNLSNAG